MAEPQLAPQWLSFHRELPSSSQEKVVQRHDRDNIKQRRYQRTNSYNHLPNHSFHHSNIHINNNGNINNINNHNESWRNADPNPRVLNRSKSSPGFDSKESPPSNEATPKSPDRSSIGFANRSMKIKVRRPLISSQSQPNLSLPEKVLSQRLRSVSGNAPYPVASSSPLSTSSSSTQSQKETSPRSSSPTANLSSPASAGLTSVSSMPSIPLVYSSTPPPSSSPPPSSPPSSSHLSTTPPSSSTSASSTSSSSTIINTNTMTVSTVQEEMQKEMEKLRGLVPSVPAINNKGMSRRGPLEPGRKGSQSKLMGGKKPPSPLSVHFRKASSEPLLPIPVQKRSTEIQMTEPEPKKPEPPALLRRFKSFKNEKTMKERLEDSADQAEVKRTTFFKDVFKQEKTIRDVTATLTGEVVSEDQIDEYEERLLRSMGWQPDEQIPFFGGRGDRSSA